MTRYLLICATAILAGTIGARLIVDELERRYHKALRH